MAGSTTVNPEDLRDILSLMELELLYLLLPVFRMNVGHPLPEERDTGTQAQIFDVNSPTYYRT